MKYRFNSFFLHKKMPSVRRKVAFGILFAFVVNTVLGPVSSAFAQAVLPLPGTMVTLSPGYSPLLIKGMRVYPENPLRFDFILDPGQSGLQGEEFTNESSKLIKYFLSSLTVPEKDLWVNLSPYEKDRIIPDAFGKTEMGRDMLAQDYILKQLTATLIYPETELGKSFWQMAYQKAQEAFGSSDIPVNTFNKVWIVPEKAVVFAKNNVAYVVETHLKVMLEEDYVALSNQKDSAESLATATDVAPKSKGINSVGSQVVRKIILPAIEKEINEGQNFAPLRQVYNSLILATWFKRNLKESILGKVYVGQNKIEGVTFADETNKERIYQDYLEAFHKGVYNFIKEEEDAVTHDIVPRKYFSGGIVGDEVGRILQVTSDEGSVGSSAITPGSPAVPLLAAVELGRSRPPRAAAVVGVAPSVFSIRGRSDFENKKVIATAGFKLVPQANSRNVSGELTILDNMPEMISRFRQAIAAATENPDSLSALQSLKPLTEYLVARLKKQTAYTDEKREQLVADEAKLKADLKGLQSFQIVFYRRMVIEAQAEIDSLSKQLAGLENNLQNSAAIQELTGKIEAAKTVKATQLNYLAQNIQKANDLKAAIEAIAPQVQSAVYIQIISDFSANRLSNLKEADSKNLLAQTVSLAAVLSDNAIERLLSSAQNKLRDFLLIHNNRRITDWNNVEIALVVNTADAFTLRNTVDGKSVLEVDLLPLMIPSNASQTLAWSYSFLNEAARDQRVTQIKTAATDKSSFVRDNAAVTAEILRILYFMERVADPYFQIGNSAMVGTDESLSRARKNFLDELQVDGRNVPLVQLIEGLGASPTKEVTRGKRTIRVPDVAWRVERALRYLKTAPQLSTVANIGNYSKADVDYIAQLYGSIGPRWFSADAGEAVVAENPETTVDGQEPVVAPLESASVRPPLDQLAVEAQSDEGPESTLEMPAQWQGRESSSWWDSFVNQLKVPGRIRRNLMIGALAIATFFGVFNPTGQEQPLVASANLGDTVVAIADVDTIPASMTDEMNLKLQDQTVVSFKYSYNSTDYPVVPGDTLSEIAERFGMKGMDYMNIFWDNQEILSSPHLIKPGMILKIRNAAVEEYRINAGDTRDSIAKEFYGNGTPQQWKRILDNNKNLLSQVGLLPGIVLKIPLSLKENQTRQEQQLSNKLNGSIPLVAPQPAASSAADNVGGINLDPTGLEIRVEGDNFKFDVPIDPQILQNLQQDPVNGFVPVILNVVPIINLQQFLGVKKSDAPKASLAFAG